MMALLLVCGLPLAAFADTYNIANGSIEISASAEGFQTVAQNGSTFDDNAPVITGTTKENTVTITAEKGATANVTIQNVNIVNSDPSGAPPVDHSGEAAVTIDVAEGAEANVTLDGVKIDVGGTGDYDDHTPGEAAVRITGKGDVTIELDGENTVQSGVFRAGVEKNDADSSGSLTITDKNGTDGSLEATGGFHASGIGGGHLGSSSNITITGSAEVTANGGAGGAGIGSGADGSGSGITITGSAEVTANGGQGGSGIGGGNNSSGSDITISGSAQVEATGGLYASGIGGGYNFNGNGTGSNITVSEDAQVKAQGGNGDFRQDVTYGAGAAIGDGGGHKNGNDPEAVKGKDAVVTTDAPQDDESYGLYVGGLKEGWVATYAPDEDITKAPGSLTYQGGIKVPGATPVPRQEPTCTDAGHEAGYEINGVLVAVTIPAKGHNVPGGYTPLNNATCTTLGTMEGYCTNCNTTVTVTDPNSKLKEHTFTTYTPDPENLATCTEDGKEIAVCDVCKTETDVRPDPAKGHNVPNGTPNGDATCVALGTMTGTCTNCSTEVTVPDPNYGPHTFTTYTPDPDHLATCTEAGTKTAVCDVCKNETDTIPDPAKNHSMGDFSTYKEATCTEAGEERAYCKNKCGHYETKDIPPQGHSFTKYISDGNATYTSDGTKTAKCDHCDATDTLPDPGSKLVFLPGAFYKVIGKDGKALVCKETNQNSVLTITAEEDFAALTGSLSGMKTLKAHGIDTIVFVTKGATSTFAIEDLLAQGASGDSYQLTHDGSTVTFTLGDGTDIRKILK